MVGVVLISHGGMAEGIISTATMLYPDICQCVSVTLWPADNPDDFQEKLKAAIAEVETGSGVMVLADIIGGTPCNRAMYLLGDKVRLLTGMSIPMLVTLLAARESSDDLDELAAEALEGANMGIVDVNEYLKDGEAK